MNNVDIVVLENAVRMQTNLTLNGVLYHFYIKRKIFWRCSNIKKTMIVILTCKIVIMSKALFFFFFYIATIISNDTIRIFMCITIILLLDVLYIDTASKHFHYYLLSMLLLAVFFFNFFPFFRCFWILAFVSFRLFLYVFIISSQRKYFKIENLFFLSPIRVVFVICIIYCVLLSKLLNQHWNVKINSFILFTLVF